MPATPRLHGWWSAIRAGREGWAVADGGVIWGVGATPLAAPSAAAANGHGGAAAPASGALVARVAERGGDVPHREHDGVLILADEPTPGEWAAEIAAEMAVPSAAADWADLWRAAVLRLALAAAHGHAAVELTARGRVIWSVSAMPLSPDRQLADRPRTAAEEISQYLGDDAILRLLDARDAAARHERREALRRIGQALYGDDWVSPLARDLKISPRTMQRWASGARDEAPSPAVLSDARALAVWIGPAVARDLRARLAALEQYAAHA
jgi:hypothetical protein